MPSLGPAWSRTHKDASRSPDWPGSLSGSDVARRVSGRTTATTAASSATPIAAARSALEVAEQAKSVGPVGELEQKVAANPADHQARFDLAVALNAAGKRKEAAEHLIAIVKRDRKWNDDGARKQLVQFFEAWGPADEATVEGRRRLSSILFA